MCCNTNIVLQARRLGWPVVSKYKRTVLWLEGLQEAKSYHNTKLYCDRGHRRWAQVLGVQGAGRVGAGCWASGRRVLTRGTGGRAAGGRTHGERGRGRAAGAAGVRARGALRHGLGARPQYGQAAHDTATRARRVRIGWASWASFGARAPGSVFDLVFRLCNVSESLFGPGS